MDQRLNEAARVGDIDALYDLIQEDEDVLEIIDKKAFAETPLHIASFLGHMKFAMEIMNMKSSFTSKLNKQGLSPLHLALQNEQKLMAVWLIDVDADLVRIKGRGGFTPLHYAIELGNLCILSEFFEVCPESIIDVTFQGETALHIAIKNNQIEAFKLLLGWLGRTLFKDASFWQREILNWKDKEGNTILHIAALRSELQVVRLLLKNKVYMNIKNFQGSTAIDTVQAQMLFCEKEIEEIQKHSPRLLARSTMKNVLKNLKRSDTHAVNSIRRNNNRSSEWRNGLLVFDALIATVTYQAALSPRGNVWQGSADSNSPIPNILHLDTSVIANTDPKHCAGSTVMSRLDFLFFWVANTSIFLQSIIRMLKSGVRRQSFPGSLL